ncbi:unnamed protein product, partial [Sphacelaria rigidula]
ATKPRFKRALDKATGRHYWYDRETRETFWTDPALASLKTTPEDPRNRRKVYGYPPTDVEALGQNRSATVWWKPVQIEGKSKSSGDKEGGGRAAGAEETERGIGNDIAGGVLGEDRDFKKLTMVGYVVYRYRLDGREWHKKGGTNVDGVETASTRVKGLQNGLVYRFTVTTRTVEGESAESEPSVAVRPNEPLPAGWKEVFNVTTGKSVYKNLKTNQTCTQRPEGKPFFVETELFLRFSPEEIAALSKAFRTRAEMANSTLIAVDDLMELLPTLGEPLLKNDVVKRLQKEGWEGSPKSLDELNVSYRQFLSFLWGIKGQKMTRRSLLRRLWDALVSSVVPRKVSAAKFALLEQDPGKRMGAWEKLVHPVVQRPYFVNKDTGKACWTTPAEVQCEDVLPT